MATLKESLLQEFDELIKTTEFETILKNKSLDSKIVKEIFSQVIIETSKIDKDESNGAEISVLNYIKEKFKQ